MRHQKKVKKLKRDREHRKALLSNLISALFLHEKIKTTLTKAKEARRFAERMINFAKRDTVAARREVRMFVKDKGVVKKLFAQIGPRFKDRKGGYTRIYKTGPRKGDSAEMAFLELVVKEEKKEGKKKKKKS